VAYFEAVEGTVVKAGFLDADCKPENKFVVFGMTLVAAGFATGAAAPETTRFIVPGSILVVVEANIGVVVDFLIGAAAVVSAGRGRFTPATCSGAGRRTGSWISDLSFGLASSTFFGSLATASLIRFTYCFCCSSPLLLKRSSSLLRLVDSRSSLVKVSHRERIFQPS